MFPPKTSGTRASANSPGYSSHEPINQAIYKTKSELLALCPKAMQSKGTQMLCVPQGVPSLDENRKSGNYKTLGKYSRKFQTGYFR